MASILNFQDWQINEELSDKEKEIFSIWKKTWQISQKKTSGDVTKNAQKTKIDQLNNQIKLIIGKDEKLKEFFKDIKDRVTTNKRENSLKTLQAKENKTAEDYLKIKELKLQIKDNNEEDDEDTKSR